MRRALFAASAVAGFIIAVAGLAFAEDKPCSGSQWSLEQEFAWMGAPDAQSARTGETLQALPEKALSVSLDPAATAKLTVPVSGKPRQLPEQAFAGSISFAGFDKPGTYQISLAAPGWIDVIQNGASLKSIAHTSLKDCPALHKSVRFAIAPGPFSIQLSSMPAAETKVTIRTAE